MIFEEITLKNFATYKGENTLKLLPESENRPIILIGGENGCGKTTLLDAFQLVLFGPASQCSNRGKLSYESFLERCINRDSRIEDGASIRLTFHFFLGGDKKHFRIERAWSKKNKKIQEQFWVYQLAEDGIRYEQALSRNWADYVESFIPTQVAPFFFFDGEKIEKLADFENSGQIVHAAIHSLLGLNTTDQLESDLLSLEKRKTKDLISNESDGQLDRLESDISSLSSEIKNLSEHISLLTIQHEIAQKKLKEVELRFRQQGGDLFEKRVELEEQRSIKQSEIDRLHDDLREVASGVAPLLIVKSLLRCIKVQAGKEELSRKEEIVCEMLDDRDQTLIERLVTMQYSEITVSDIRQYLETDRIDRRVASSVERYLKLNDDDTKLLTQLIDSDIPRVENDLPDLLQQISTTKSECDEIQRSLAGVPGEDNIAEILEERNQAILNHKNSQAKLDALIDDRERLKRQQELKQHEIKRELERKSNLSLELSDTGRVLQYSARVRQTITILRSKLIEKHMNNIEQLVVDSFRTLLRKESLVKRIEIDRESYQVCLFNKNDQQILPDRLSAGERQLLATALLWGICQAAGKPLPTIIDTPLGRLDTSHRTNLIKNYFPKASHQVLLLSTNEEIVGKYHDLLKPHISHTCLLRHDEIIGGTTFTQGYFS